MRKHRMFSMSSDGNPREQVGTSVKDSGSNRYLILRKTGGRSFLAAKLNGGNSFFGHPPGRRARNFGGLAA
jgi:hypothetical protein